MNSSDKFSDSCETHDESYRKNNNENYLNKSSAKVITHANTEIPKNDMQDVTTITPSTPDLVSSEE